MCSIPGCGGPLPSAIAVPRLCLAHAEEARQRNAIGRLSESGLLTAAAVLLSCAIGVVLALVAAGTFNHPIVLLPLAVATSCLAGLVVLGRRAVAREESEPLGLSGETPPPDYDPRSRETPPPDYSDR